MLEHISDARFEVMRGGIVINPHFQIYCKAVRRTIISAVLNWDVGDPFMSIFINKHTADRVHHTLMRLS